MDQDGFPSIGLGCASFGGVFGDVDRQECIRIVKVAYEMGVRYFDTAPWYGGGKSEETLGEALSLLPRDEIFISTKVCRYRGQEMFDFSKESIESSLDRSLNLLKVSYVDLLIVHDVEFALQPEKIARVLPVLEELRSKRLIRFIGISGYDLDFLLDVLKLSKVAVDYVLSYARFTLFDTSYRDYINAFKEKNVRIILASMTGMGLLTEGGSQFWHPAGDDVKSVCEEIKLYCKTKEINVAQVAYAFAYVSGVANTLLLGSKTVSEFHQNMQAFDGLCPKLQEEALFIRESIVKNKDYNWLNVEVNKYKAKLQRRDT